MTCVGLTDAFSSTPIRIADSATDTGSGEPRKPRRFLPMAGPVGSGAATASPSAAVPAACSEGIAPGWQVACEAGATFDVGTYALCVRPLHPRPPGSTSKR